MKKTLAFLMAAMMMAGGASACSSDSMDDVLIRQNEESGSVGNENEQNNDKSDMFGKVSIKIGNSTFTATLQDNPAARSFANLLPLTIQMSEMNGNEKYYYLPNSLPTSTYRPGTIQAGDLLLWGDNCVVLFYETFSSSYSYTRIGKIDNPEGLGSAVGSGSVSVSFSAQE